MGLGGAPRRPTVAGYGANKPPQIPGKSRAGSEGFIGGGSELADLPAPKRASPLAGAPRTPGRQTRSPLDGIDMPGAGPLPPGLSEADLDEIVDLPAPKRASDDNSEVDLPAPVGPKPTKGVAGAAAGDHIDLPAPVGPKPTKGGIDLPAPVGPTPTKGGIGLPTPVGPTPTKSGVDLPAPKGFFDNIPASKGPTPTPARSTPTELGLDVRAEPPAPKGFFDDVPAPKGPSGSGIDLPAPKGFFDDVPAPKGPTPIPRSEARSGATGVLDLDDLDLEPSRMAPLPSAPQSPDAPAAQRGLGAAALDLGGPESQSSGASPFALDSLELDDSADAGAGPAPAVPLELDGDPPGSSSGGSFDGIELAAPTTAPKPAGAGVVTFSTPSRPADAGASSAASFAPARGPAMADDSLELAAEVEPPRGTVSDGAGGTDVVARGADLGVADDPKARKATKSAKAKKDPRARRKQQIVTAAAVTVVLLGAGGFYGYTKWQAKKATAAKVDSNIALAQKQINSDQWTKAAASAEKVLALQGENDDALGLAAQAYYAAAIDTGINADALIAKGEEHFQVISKAAAKGAEVDKAKGLRALTERNPRAAIKTLSAVAKKNKRDGSAQLYLGWAHAQAGDFTKAAAAFAAAAKKAPKRLPALYGLGMAHIELGQVEPAREALLQVIEIDKQHIGAQIGIAQIVAVDRFNDRENRYLEILQSADLDTKDPRAVSRAWSLAGDEALSAGRIDEAVARYTKALELDPNNIAGQVGEGKAAVAQGRYDAARERLKVALSQRPEDVEALVALCEASVALSDWDPAFNSIEKALKIDPKAWRTWLVQGMLLQAFPESEKGAAEDSYRTAMKLAGDGEIAPTVALSRLLVAQNRGAEALEVLKPIEAAAEKDAPLAVTLGVAYLGTGDPVRAETWFRKALERRPNDVEAQLQLGLALSRQGRTDQAIAVLKAAYEDGEGREDVGVRLALVYEQVGDVAAAEQAYNTLLAQPGVSINVRARAGRFYARNGMTDRAVTLGESILAENDRNAAGHFLRAEGLYHAGELAEAQAEYQQATLIDPQAQYYEGLGRAAEKQNLLDEALNAYQKSVGLDGKYVLPRLGRARIRVARREYNLALDELEVARELAPENPWVYFYLGECLYETDQDRDAAKAYSQAVRLDPKHAYAHYRLGMAYVDLDKARDAAGALATATRLAEGSEAAWLADAFRLLGTASRTLKRRGDAIKAFRAYLDMAPPGDAQAKDVKKLLLRLEGGGW
jgi:tetratricopeptide (TPR) repeat protein